MRTFSTIDFGRRLERSAGNPPAHLNFSPMADVLVVDDEALIRWSVAESLEAAGHRVAEAATARETLDLLTAGAHPSVVILDLKLPDSSDLGLLRRVRALAPACRIVLMTAHGTAEVLDEARRAGAFDVLTKPFEMSRVVNIVRAAAAH